MTAGLLSAMRARRCQAAAAAARDMGARLSIDLTSLLDARSIDLTTRGWPPPDLEPSPRRRPDRAQTNTMCHTCRHMYSTHLQDVGLHIGVRAALAADGDGQAGERAAAHVRDPAPTRWSAPACDPPVAARHWDHSTAAAMRVYGQQQAIFGTIQQPQRCESMNSKQRRRACEQLRRCCHKVQL